MKTSHVLFSLSFLVFICVCGCSAEWPNAAPSHERARLWPDYTDLVIPHNIAPLNCELKNSAEACRFKLASFDGKDVYAGAGTTLTFPLKRWRSILEASKGKYVTLDIAVQRSGEWVKLVTTTNPLASHRS